jgi:acyl carrier protein
MQEDPNCLAVVIDILREISGVSDIRPEGDFYDAGVTSVQSLPLLMELETRFEVVIPDERFIAARSARQLCELIGEIRAT